MRKYFQLLLLVPFLMCVLLPWANRTEPYVFGIPFLLFWIVLWMLFSSFIILVVYKLDPANKGSEIE